MAWLAYPVVQYFFKLYIKCLTMDSAGEGVTFGEVEYFYLAQFRNKYLNRNTEETLLCHLYRLAMFHKMVIGVDCHECE